MNKFNLKKVVGSVNLEDGSQVFIRALSVGDMKNISEAIKVSEMDGLVSAFIAGASDAEGNKLFSEKDKAKVLDIEFGDVKAVCEKVFEYIASINDKASEVKN